MEKEEYYNRIKKIENELSTDIVSADKEYHFICQKYWLSTKYIDTLETQLKKQKEVIDKIQKIINTEIKLMGYAVNDSCLMLIQDILNEVTNNE